MSSAYFFGKSFGSESTWADLGKDLLWFLGSMLGGMVVYFVFNGSPFEVVTLDLSDADERKEGLSYTEEEARERYGPDEGQVFGDDVQICGQKLPKRRALKFMKLSDDVMRESLSQYWRGSGGTVCNGCKNVQEGDEKYAVCGRCQYTTCKDCRVHKKLGTCYCKDENFGIPYPPVAKRKFYQKGMW